MSWPHAPVYVPLLLSQSFSDTKALLRDQSYPLSICFSMSFICTTMGVLAVGGTCVITGPDFKELMKAVSKHKVFVRGLTW